MQSKKIPTLNSSMNRWIHRIKRIYKKDGNKKRIKIKSQRKTFRLTINKYVEITGKKHFPGKIEGITAIGSGDGTKNSGIAIMYGYILLINSIFPKYTDKDIQYVLKQLKLIGKKRIQNNSQITVHGVTFWVKKNEAGTMLSCTPI